ncbi:hypothetical protein PIB30_021865 [Stylosanthes scabra]|uniref:RRM domain-containing protein n=1 Tax=Stylosanthes scabra TaxID=79078 RepID=A0ABU6Q9B2_9FABA|nr:hypothetical protein [Stylosanthes scabra]
MKNDFHTIFVDNLPLEVTKRDMFKEFGKDGYILDVFISRRRQRNSINSFAFVRYQVYGGALSHKHTTEWEALAQCKSGEQRNENAVQGDLPESSVKKKVIQTEWAEEEKHRMGRSLLGVSVKPIEFRDVMYYIISSPCGRTITLVFSKFSSFLSKLLKSKHTVRASSRERLRKAIESWLLDKSFVDLKASFTLRFAIKDGLWLNAITHKMSILMIKMIYDTICLMAERLSPLGQRFS